MENRNDFTELPRRREIPKDILNKVEHIIFDSYGIRCGERILKSRSNENRGWKEIYIYDEEKQVFSYKDTLKILFNPKGHKNVKSKSDEEPLEVPKIPLNTPSEADYIIYDDNNNIIEAEGYSQENTMQRKLVWRYSDKEKKFCFDRAYETMRNPQFKRKDDIDTNVQTEKKKLTFIQKLRNRFLAVPILVGTIALIAGVVINVKNTEESHNEKDEQTEETKPIGLEKLKQTMCLKNDNLEELDESKEENNIPEGTIVLETDAKKKEEINGKIYTYSKCYVVDWEKGIIKSSGWLKESAIDVTKNENEPSEFYMEEVPSEDKKTRTQLKTRDKYIIDKDTQGVSYENYFIFIDKNGLMRIYNIDDIALEVINDNIQEYTSSSENLDYKEYAIVGPEGYKEGCLQYIPNSSIRSKDFIPNSLIRSKDFRNSFKWKFTPDIDDIKKLQKIAEETEQDRA